MARPSSDPVVEIPQFTDGEAYERLMGRWSRLAGAIFLDWLAPPSGLRWLDVGCGNGAFTELLVERCAPSEVLGIDPSEEQLAFARDRASTAIVEFQQGDAQALPFEDGVFDIAAMALAINLIPDPAKAVEEMARVVRRGGWVATYMWDILGGREARRVVELKLPGSHEEQLCDCGRYQERDGKVRHGWMKLPEPGECFGYVAWGCSGFGHRRVAQRGVAMGVSLVHCVVMPLGFGVQRNLGCGNRHRREHLLGGIGLGGFLVRLMGQRPCRSEEQQDQCCPGRHGSGRHFCHLNSPCETDSLRAAEIRTRVRTTHTIRPAGVRTQEQSGTRQQP